MVRQNALDHYGLRVLENTFLWNIYSESSSELCALKFLPREREENNSLSLKLRASESKNKMASTEEDHVHSVSANPKDHGKQY